MLTGFSALAGYPYSVTRPITAAPAVVIPPRSVTSSLARSDQTDNAFDHLTHGSGAPRAALQIRTPKKPPTNAGGSRRRHRRHSPVDRSSCRIFPYPAGTPLREQSAHAEHPDAVIQPLAAAQAFVLAQPIDIIQQPDRIAGQPRRLGLARKLMDRFQRRPQR